MVDVTRAVSVLRSMFEAMALPAEQIGLSLSKIREASRRGAAVRGMVDVDLVLNVLVEKWIARQKVRGRGWGAEGRLEKRRESKKRKSTLLNRTLCNSVCV